MRKGLAAVALAATVTIAGCSGDSGTRLGRAFCSDLRAGYSPFQILRESVKDGTYSPETAADRAYAWAAIDCPEQLRTNEALRGYLEGWNINPDA